MMGPASRPHTLPLIEKKHSTQHQAHNDALFLLASRGDISVKKEQVWSMRMHRSGMHASFESPLLYYLSKQQPPTCSSTISLFLGSMHLHLRCAA